MTRFARAHDPTLKAVCPQCKRRRFIIAQFKPYCTSTCKRAAEAAKEVTNDGEPEL